MEEGLAQMESPFTSKFGTNFAPSPKEILDIQKILLEPAKELHVLDEQIAHLQTRRDKLKSFIDNHRALLSPIRRVPSDILREIFVQCLPEDRLPTHNIHQAPLLLTGICRSWREVAITTPRLWNRIHIWLRYPRSPPITEFFHSLMKASAEGLDLWLERSGTMPLTLSLHASTPSSLSSRDPWNFNTNGGRVKDIEMLYINFARHLLPYAARWKSLSITISARVMDFLKALPEEFELTSLEEFRPTRPPEMMNWEALDVVFRRSPSLRSVQLDDGYLERLSIPCGNLTEVAISGLREDVLFHNFKRVLSPSCASLRHCTLDILIPMNSTIWAIVGSPVVLPMLHTLKVQIRSPQIPTIALALQHLFDAITAPMLKTLHITSRNYLFHNDCLDRLPFVPFLERSGCTLSSFALDLPVKVADLIAVFRLAPSLVELKLRDSNIKEANAPLSEFFDALTPTPMDPDVLCPRLESLTCVRCSASASASLIALAEARNCIEPRCPGIQKLKRMRVSLRDFAADPEIPAKLKGLREQGMVVQWSSPPDLCRKLVNEQMWSDGLPMTSLHNSDWEPDPSDTHFY
ncbi:hypothetical protein Moror_17149 [Moniliophthora roreri MCA 2997]|uniref:Uncharacterized protein n=2 Tax=Moniliophthora roreri TaxID=221103 RepID=V2X7K1_MONRO|nr:hypothetical protein Moror_17149 [Moniliophthora roreri MCA 2997]